MRTHINAGTLKMNWNVSILKPFAIIKHRSFCHTEKYTHKKTPMESVCCAASVINAPHCEPIAIQMAIKHLLVVIENLMHFCYAHDYIQMFVIRTQNRMLGHLCVVLSASCYSSIWAQTLNFFYLWLMLNLNTFSPMIDDDLFLTCFFFVVFF